MTDSPPPAGSWLGSITDLPGSVIVDVKRAEVIAWATEEHNKTCACDPRYLMSCPKMAAAILATAATPGVRSDESIGRPEAIGTHPDALEALDAAELAGRLADVARSGGALTFREARAAGLLPPRRLPTFQESRSAARRLLGDAADEIRAGDWRPAPSGRQRDAIRRALDLIGQAKAALDEAGR